jgi:nitroimidazol reductase NimA-like FMN-containing flavoprotein (pyridoxamine 5'-phosphate oxidase superfamily)
MATAPTARTRVRRVPQRGQYERETIEAILDEALVSHVGFVHDGQPVVIPTLHARLGDRLYLHGSAASRMLRTLHKGVPVCVTTTLVDGLVLARSAFHHSVNYRSVVVFGTATLVEPGDETVKVLELFTEKLVPGRWADVRPPTRQELKGTKVLSLALDEASAKVRTGPPIDDDEDYDLPVWAGVLPLATKVAEPQPDPRLDPGIETPGYVAAWRP